MRNRLVNTHQGLIERILERRLRSPYEIKIRSRVAGRTRSQHERHFSPRQFCPRSTLVAVRSRSSPALAPNSWAENAYVSLPHNNKTKNHSIWTFNSRERKQSLPAVRQASAWRSPACWRRKAYRSPFLDAISKR